MTDHLMEYAASSVSTQETTHAAQMKKKKKPCRICDQFKHWAKEEEKHVTTSQAQATSHAAPNTSQQSSQTSQNAPQKTTKTTSQQSAKSQTYEPFPCPPDSQELGRHTWTFLHTLAAYYPSQPTPSFRTTMQSFLSTFSQVYPCNWCATHMQEYLQQNPPTLNNEKEFSQWMCLMHNDVNKRIGKPEFDCSRVFERWKDGPVDKEGKERCGIH